ncbi:endonuclease/exonuclease/phosphatase family protein [Lutimonas halocynthiae]|uniref:endonuclease/exonuclease/phosphatase family protein n=1 Tax=Lutimonas halocynthiae TaxID=1446477 RepID=UPI0025B4CDA1|nr:endonuclease/exonuclease/phosphatase family protein [Lutimonas halocynthiae]MDN3641504.1 endonuclease/exonuclease/phosphatase family protein [Lutimonas halocynthiae]
MRFFFIIIFLIASFQTNWQNSEKYHIKTIGFYNVENLFDTVDDSLTFDEDYTLNGKNHYSKTDYIEKINKTARVISEIGSGKINSGPCIIGLAEIENFKVLDDLVHTIKLQNFAYQIIQKDSPDRRGIDVALLYREADFLPLETKFIEVRLWNERGERIYTRDILYVNGILDNDEIHIIVNHWPSRRGGKSRSETKRMKTAYLVRQLTDSITLANPEAKILILGDFNDDPIDKSIKKGLLKPIQAENNVLYPFFNPMEVMFKKGWNSMSYRDGLHLFDQIILSSNLKSDNSSINGYVFYRAGIYNPSYLISQKGKYKGYPLRSFENNRYAGGYSDHFPVYVQLIKPFSDK